jgi:hypothetical protein
MDEKEVKSPLSEQKICVACGMCCDGTLFERATLQPGEKGHLPPWMEENYRIVDGKECFPQPCHYFNGKCTIYNQKKAHVCSAYRCLLLKDFSKGKVTQEQSLQIVSNALRLREEILADYRNLFPGNEILPFRFLLKKLWEIKNNQDEGTPLNIEMERLMGKCNIFEALLIRYFKSADDFNKMMAPENQNEEEVKQTKDAKNQ